MTLTQDIHAWFREHLEAYLLGGLAPDERRQLESHAAICAACELALADARQADAGLRDLFAFVAPAPDFEDQLIATLRAVPTKRRLVFPPLLRRSLVGLAAAVLLAGFGLLGNRILKDGKFPELSLSHLPFVAGPAKSDRVKVGSTLRGIGPTTQLSSNESAMRTYEVRDLVADVPDFDQVLDLKLQAQQQIKAGQYDGASKTINDILSRDPNNDYARGVQSLVQEKAAVANGRSMVLYDDILRYPAEWPDISDRRAKAAPTAGPAHKDDSKPAQAAEGFDAYYAQSLGWRNGPVALDGTNKLGTTVINLSGGIIDPAKQAANWGVAVNRGETKPDTNGIVAFNTQPVTGMDATSTHGGRPAASHYWSYGFANGAAPTGSTPAANTQTAGDTSKLGRVEAKEEKPAEKDSKSVTELSFRLNDSNADGTVATTGRNLGESERPKVAIVDPKKLGAQDTDEVHLPALAKAVKQTGGQGQDQADPNTGAGAPAPEPAPAPEAAAPTPPATQQQLQRKIIRNGTVEFEVDSFDSAFMQIQKIVTEETGFVSSTDSEKLPNGKVKGTVTVRVPPEHLDVLVLKLRGLGDLKSQRIAAQDITKQYTDLESGLRAARTMETRLLEIIKTGKGEVKDLVEAEKQLGVYREKIEQIEGELRYYANLVSLSTLNITLFERDIRTPTAAFESESVNAGIETEDVEKARADAMKAIDDYKGRVIESNLQRQDSSGNQLTATIVAEVSPESTGPLTDRLKQLGRVSRLEAERKQTTQGGTGAPTPGVKLERRATRFNISLYNLANSTIRPRQTVNVTIAATDVESARSAILSAMRGGGENAPQPLGRVISSTLTGQKSDQASAAISLEVKSEQVPAIDAVLSTLGETMNRSIAENADANDVTRAKQGYSISLISIAQVQPRESQTLGVAAKDVPASYAKVLALLQNPKQPARILTSTLNEQDRQNITGTIDFELPRSALSAVDSALGGADSAVYSRNVTRSADAQNTLDTKVRVTMTLIAADHLAPRESTRMELEVADVDKAVQDVVSSADTAGGRVIARQLTKQHSGQTDAQVVVDVPLATAPATLDHLRALGSTHLVQATKNPQVPEGPLARARFDVTLRNPMPMVAAEDTAGYRLRQGVRTSLTGLTYSLMLIVIGLCLIGPFVIVAWIGWKLFRRRKSKVAAATTT